MHDNNTHSQGYLHIPQDTSILTKEIVDPVRNQIEHIDIPKNITKIGRDAFRDCSSLKSITIPNSVTKISEQAFIRCSSLTSITIPDGVTYIGDHAFTGCSSLETINIPNSVISISSRAFANCSSLKSITIPDSVFEIGIRAFSNCTSLESVTIPDGVTLIGIRAFYNCSSLTHITIPDGVTGIDSFTGFGIFEKCSNLTTIDIPDNVTNIKYGTFSGCTSLTSITIPNSVTYIGEQAFNSCSSLTTINIPDSVTNIEEGAFNGCSSLTFIKVPNGVTEIGLSAFENCSSLNHIIIPDNLSNQDTNYWEGRGIDLNKTQLITHKQLSEWAKKHKLKEKSIEKLSTLYQLQNDDDYQPSWSELGKNNRHIIIGDLLTILPKDKTNVVLPRILIGQHDNKEEQLLHTLSLLSRATEEHAVQEKVSSHEDTSTQTKASQESQKANSLSLGASLSSNLTLAETAKILLLSVEKPKKAKNTPSSSTDEVSSAIPPIRTSPDKEDYPNKKPRGR